ncbi:hypothetical protein AcV5_010000 [Taiwanofungus camphoratus]|nr:hypothetical protein AcV5_010000 [Antrodia cinnamomea]
MTKSHQSPSAAHAGVRRQHFTPSETEAHHPHRRDIYTFQTGGPLPLTFILVTLVHAGKLMHQPSHPNIVYRSAVQVLCIHLNHTWSHKYLLLPAFSVFSCVLSFLDLLIWLCLLPAAQVALPLHCSCIPLQVHSQKASAGPKD